VLRAGLETADWITVDDTGARHRGANAVCTQIGNDSFAWFGCLDGDCSGHGGSKQHLRRTRFDNIAGRFRRGYGGVGEHTFLRSRTIARGLIARLRDGNVCGIARLLGLRLVKPTDQGVDGLGRHGGR